jgi:antitoxin VapB
MALNIKSEEVVRLAAEVARLTGETKTEAIRKALEERKRRLAYRVSERAGADGIRRFLEREIWPLVPENVRGSQLSKREREKILGYGKGGV